MKHLSDSMTAKHAPSPLKEGIPHEKKNIFVIPKPNWLKKDYILASLGEHFVVMCKKKNLYG